MGSKPAWLRVQMIMELNVPFYRLGERQGNGLNQAIVSNKYTTSINFIVSLTIMRRTVLAPLMALPDRAGKTGR